MSLVFPPAFWKTDLVGAFVPFNLQPVYTSPSFERLLLNDDGSFKSTPIMGEENYLMGRIMRAYFLILEKYYGIRRDIDYPIIQVVPDPDTGLDLYVRIKPNLRFIEVHAKGELKKLTEEDRTRILENLTNPTVLREILPPENFEFQGFGSLYAFDVTQSEIISALERSLIDQESIFSKSGFQLLQQKLRILFRSPNLVAGLAAILGTAFVVSLLTGVQTPLFAVVLFAAVGALAYAEQRYNGAASQHRVSTSGIGRRVHHA